jgi:hypothetical protein
VTEQSSQSPEVPPPPGMSPSPEVPQSPQPSAAKPDRGLGPIPGFTRRPPGRPWYRRWGLWLVVAAAVAAAVIISDLPKSQNDAQQATVVSGVLHEVSTDVHPCVYAVAEAFRTFYFPAIHGTLPATSQKFAHQYLSQDQQACSFENTGIFGMTTITVPNSPAGRQLSAVIKTVLEWATSDANGAIADIQTLLTHPHSRAALGDLARRERRLASDRAAELRDVRRAEAELGGQPLPSVGLPAFSHLATPSS